MSFTSAQLAAELANDPKTLGYAALVAAKDRNAIAAKLNSTYAGVGTIWRTDVGNGEILAQIVWSEIAGMTAGQASMLSALLSPAVLDASNARVRALFAGLLSTATTTLANITAISKSQLSSRAEELWGYGTRIVAQDLESIVS